MNSITDIVPAGVITGDDVLTLFEHARANGYAIPAVNCTRYVSFARAYVRTTESFVSSMVSRRD